MKKKKTQKHDIEDEIDKITLKLKRIDHQMERIEARRQKALLRQSKEADTSYIR